MIKIAYMVSTLQKSGPVNVLYNIVKYLNLKEIEVHIYTMSEEKKNSRKKEFEELGCNIKKININNINLITGKVENVQNQIIKDNIDIVHSHCFRSTLLISKLEKVKKIVTVHSYIREDYRYAFGFLKSKIMELLFFNSLKKIDKVICCSKSVKKQISAIYKGKLEYIQNGVDLEFFNSDKSKFEIRKKLNLDLEKIIYISVGSLCDRKNAYFIANEFNKRKLKNEVLIYLGDGIQMEQIKLLGNKNIICIGNVNNVFEYLNSSDYYISASKSEGLPNSVLESLAMGRPVLLSDIPSHKEIIEEEKNIGLIFEEGNGSDFNLKMNQIKNQNYQEMSEKALKVILEKFSAKLMSEKYSERYLL